MKIINRVSVFGRKKIEFIGIKNECCTNGNMEKVDDKYFKCKTCSRVFVTDSKEINHE